MEYIESITTICRELFYCYSSILKACLRHLLSCHVRQDNWLDIWALRVSIWCVIVPPCTSRYYSVSLVISSSVFSTRFFRKRVIFIEHWSPIQRLSYLFKRTTNWTKVFYFSSQNVGLKPWNFITSCPHASLDSWRKTLKSVQESFIFILVL